MDGALLAVFIPTFLTASITPAICMTLAMTLSMSIGIKRTLWMMLGEVTGLMMIGATTIAGAATLLLNYPEAFAFLKAIGGAYLIYLGTQLWFSTGKLAIKEQATQESNVLGLTRTELVIQGFFAAAANPKDWGFIVALLPPFIDSQQPLLPQALILLSLIAIIEFCCLLIYASGGKILMHLLEQRSNFQRLNRVTGTALAAIGVWFLLH